MEQIGSSDATQLGSGICIRTVDADDPVLLRVRDLCYETLHRPFGVPRDDAWNEADPHSTHLVALDGDRLAGYVRLIRVGDAGQVRQVTVDPAYRNGGLASALVSEAVSRARMLGLSLVFLHARERAVGVYERLGFLVTDGPFRMGRTYLAHVRMELRLR
jgi:ribosomal protein S18 acetylase RimI-like enzyme